MSKKPTATAEAPAESIKTYSAEDMQKMIQEAVMQALATKAGEENKGRPAGFSGIWDETAALPTVPTEKPEITPTGVIEMVQAPPKVTIKGDAGMLAGFGISPAQAYDPNTMHANGGALPQIPTSSNKTQIQVAPMQFGRRR